MYFKQDIPYIRESLSFVKLPKSVFDWDTNVLSSGLRKDVIQCARVLDLVNYRSTQKGEQSGFSQIESWI